MRTDLMAQAYLERAGRCLQEAREAMRARDYPGAVRRSQESVEFSLKAMLRLVGVEYPREHDVSRVLLEVESRFPKWFSRDIPKMAEFSRDLAMKRGPSAYGDEKAGVPPRELFKRDDGEAAVRAATFTLARCEKFFGWFTKAGRRGGEAAGQR